ncbi:conjugal transfer protein TrbD [Pandoraea cepalis]|uniref:Conjugal transfer protein TrbD n=1 Tax=Pandoraea cepalis TaxID=2508294 RepID=A0AAW7MH19_9BURK|nr:conjugal transfer protein TrbD [Pandoraea cepalis]MDN4572049.1 conjugal transfer protein TrbD [Pandoraea cepalis]MDN4578895.1 conjugal transfer protein TrbD [Pandoraea cepalis]
MDEPRRVVLRQSLVRPILLAGAERKLTLVAGTLSAAMVFGVQSKEAIFAGVVFWLLAHWGLVQAAKKDPQLSLVYPRHLMYQPYYEPVATVFAPPGLVKMPKPHNPTFE